MKSERRKPDFNSGTFLKVWAYSAVLVLSLFTAHAAGVFGSGGISGRGSDLLASRTGNLATLAEDLIVRDAVRSLPALSGDGSKNPERFRSTVQGWLERNPRVISADFWRPGEPAPLRVVNDVLLQRLESETADSADFRDLQVFMKPGGYPRNAGTRGVHFHSFLERKPFDRSLLCVVVSSEPGNASFAVSIRLQIVDPTQFLSVRLYPGERITLVADGKRLEIFPTASAEAPGTGKRIRSVGMTIPFRLLPWKMVYSARIEDPFRSILGIRFWLNACLAVVLCLFLSYGLTRWIDRPFDRLMETAVEIGRGNFGIRVPLHNNRSMNRLAKLINYMAMEMDHLQKMNVSAIINEKNKTEIILRNIADGVLVLDAEGKIMLVNTTAEKWLRIDEPSVLQKPFKECLRSKPLVSLLQEVFKDRPFASSEFLLKQPESRQERTILASTTRVTGREGRTIGTVTVLRDVTKEREADRIKTELVSMVAHELKSPLTSIYGFSELLAESESQNKKSAEYARIIQGEASRLTDFVNKFLSLSRLESGKVKIKMDPFDLRPVIEKTVGLFKAQADQKNILIVIQAPDPLPLVVGDQELVDQVLVNLVSNAIKYSPQQSKIGIELNAGPKEVWVNIIDNGYGIPRESLPKIFDKFYRVSESAGEEETEGSGLGLALAKEIIEKHGGYIKVKSKLGVGSVFTFSLLKAEMAMKPQVAA